MSSTRGGSEGRASCKPQYKYIYIYIYIYIFSPVKPELGVIPSGQKKTFNSEHFNFPGKELNVTDITEQ